MAANLSSGHFLLESPLQTRKTGVRRPTMVAKPCRCEAVRTEGGLATVKNGDDSLVICRVLNGMWQTSGGWGRIDRDGAVDAMLRYADAGLTTFDMADHYGPAEDLYGMFINRVRRERPAELLNEVKGLTKWVPPPVKMTSSYVRDSINVSRKRMDVACLDMLQFHWWDYSNSGYLDALRHLTDLKEEGKIKTVALTNFDTERLHIILENGIPIVSNQMVDAWGGWSLFQVLLQTLKKVASKHGVSIPTVAVRYILDQPSVAGSMIGVRLGLSQHIEDSLAIFSLELDEEDKSSIDSVSKQGRDLLQIIGDCGDEYRRA
ncbi:uncharacterized protein LOC116246449 isoform X3 [Nymphaea colorata]|uniref:uncharacterized protein LOC116246449 isoform X3 n=1 Tax=Nymphaea colorata TaxID=210225 RepID=UPI00129EBAEE|nr:uncharacterized protein LOC116246449 isoform X3 [Nymphaea colorata]